MLPVAVLTFAVSLAHLAPTARSLPPDIAPLERNSLKARRQYAAARKRYRAMGLRRAEAMLEARGDAERSAQAARCAAALPLAVDAVAADDARLSCVVDALALADRAPWTNREWARGAGFEGGPPAPEALPAPRGPPPSVVPGADGPATMRRVLRSDWPAHRNPWPERRVWTEEEDAIVAHQENMKALGGGLKGLLAGRPDVKLFTLAS